MVQKQNIYTVEFKREAVKLLETSGKSGAKIAEELGISDGSLYTWRKQLNEQLGQERDILTQAIAIFSQPPPQK